MNRKIKVLTIGNHLVTPQRKLWSQIERTTRKNTDFLVKNESLHFSSITSALNCGDLNDERYLYHVENLKDYIYNQDIIVIDQYLSKEGDIIDMTFPIHLADLITEKAKKWNLPCPAILILDENIGLGVNTSRHIHYDFFKNDLNVLIKTIKEKARKISLEFSLINPFLKTNTLPSSYGIIKDTKEVVPTFDMIQCKFSLDRIHCISCINDTIIPTVRLMVSQGDGLSILSSRKKILRSIRVFDLDGPNHNTYYSKSFHVNGWNAAKWQVNKMETDGYEMSQKYITSFETLDKLNIISNFALKLRESAEIIAD